MVQGPVWRFHAGRPPLPCSHGLAAVGRSPAGPDAASAPAMLILLFVAYQLWGTGLAEARSQDRLRVTSSERSLGADVDHHAARRASRTRRPLGPAPPPTPTGEAVAIIRIPKIGVEKAVVEGVARRRPEEGPGPLPDTPMPGQPGNAAIAGHRTTYGAPFYRPRRAGARRPDLGHDPQGEFSYEVRENKVVRPRRTRCSTPRPTTCLTLTTCHPRFAPASAWSWWPRSSATAAPAPPPSAEPEAPARRRRRSREGPTCARGRGRSSPATTRARRRRSCGACWPGWSRWPCGSVAAAGAGWPAYVIGRAGVPRRAVRVLRELQPPAARQRLAAPARARPTNPRSGHQSPPWAPR